MSLPLDDRLWTGRLPANPRGLVLLLHGGAEHGLSEVDHRSLAYRRTRLMAAAKVAIRARTMSVIRAFIAINTASYIWILSKEL